MQNLEWMREPFIWFFYTRSHRVNYETIKKNRDIILIDASCALLTFSFYHKPTHPPPPPFPKVSRLPLPAKCTTLPSYPMNREPIRQYHILNTISQCTLPILHPFRSFLLAHWTIKPPIAPYITILPYEPWTSSPIPYPKYHFTYTITRSANFLLAHLTIKPPIATPFTQVPTEL